MSEYSALPNKIRMLINARNSFGSFSEYSVIYVKHHELIENSIPAIKVINNQWGEPRVVRSITSVLQQAQLHRAIRLFEGALYAAISENVYSMALSIRGYYETTASLGYLHSRLCSLKSGTIDTSRFHRDVSTQVLGSRDINMLSNMEANQYGTIKAKQILDMLKHADKTVSTHIFGGTAKEYDILNDSYLWLSEFCHPNFHSNSVSFDLVKSVPEFRFRHDKPMRDRDCEILKYLLISGPIFTDLFQNTSELLSEVLT